MLKNIFKISFLRSVRQVRHLSTIPIINDKQIKLQKFLHSKIRLNGPISVSEFMEEALTNMKYGYYTTRDPLGKEGDFITSPEISQLFGEILAFWSVNFWQSEGMPKRFQLIEFGPGRGTMADDITRTLGQLQKRVLKDVEVTLSMVEVSPTLSKRQFNRLCVKENKVDSSSAAYMSGETKHGFTINWYHSMDHIPDDQFTIILAHEFFDALPIHKFQKTDKGYREVVVDIDPSSQDHGLRFVILPNSNLATKTLIQEDEERDHVEVCPKAGIITQEICTRLNKSGGAALIMDYGHYGTKGDTLRGFEKHKLCEDILKNVGNIDITADVDFKYLSHYVKQSDARHVGPVPQSSFLRSMGIDLLHQRLLMQCRTAAQTKQVRSSYEWMMKADKMGTRFNFFAILSSQTALGKTKPVAGF